MIHAGGISIGAPTFWRGPVTPFVVTEKLGCTVAAATSTTRYRSTESGPGIVNAVFRDVATPPASLTTQMPVPFCAAVVIFT